jgi:cell wall-associated NlpC family hydrolase
MVGGLAEVVLPNGGAVLLKAGALRPIDSNMTPSVTGRLIVREAQKFLGTPYLWGGLSPAGFDCSGLVRAVFARFGRYVPRDTKDQINAGHKVPRECIKSGDLVFFERHVGIAIGQSRIIHASLAGGGVRINSLVPGTADYREDLDNRYSQARRIL